MRHIIAHCRLRDSRRGTTAVETAFVLPIFLLFVLGLIELGHAQMVKNVLRASCRAAARAGTTTGTSTATVKNKALDVLKSAVKASSVELFVKDASAFDSSASPPTSGSSIEALPNLELTAAKPKQLFLVRAKIHYKDVAIVPNIPLLNGFLDNVVLEGQAVMRHE